MHEEKSFCYTLILGVCILISLLLLGKMLLASPAPIFVPPHSMTEIKGEQHEMYLNEIQLAEMLATHLPENFPVKDLSVTVKQDGTVRADGVLTRDKLSAMVQDNGALRAALRLMPAEFPLQCVFDATCNGAAIILSPRELKAGSFQLPATVFSADMTNAMNIAVGEALAESGMDFSAVRLTDGAVELLA